MSNQATVCVGGLWLLPLVALYWVGDGDVIFVALIVAAAVSTVALGAMLGVEGRTAWIVALPFFGTILTTASATASARARDDCGECYPGFVFLPAFVALSVLFGVGAGIGAVWRRKRQRDQAHGSMTPESPNL